jgi:hypothetical protein
MHMLAALDLATGRLFYRIRTRKRWLEFVGLLKALRARALPEAVTAGLESRPAAVVV